MVKIYWMMFPIVEIDKKVVFLESFINGWLISWLVDFNKNPRALLLIQLLSLRITKYLLFFSSPGNVHTPPSRQCFGSLEHEVLLTEEKLQKSASSGWRVGEGSLEMFVPIYLPVEPKGSAQSQLQQIWFWRRIIHARADMG